MDGWALVGAIVGSAAFGAVAGKLLEAYILTPIVDKYERKKWLRQTKIEAFTKLIEEMLSLGLRSSVHDDRWLFQAIATKTILLLDDEELIDDIAKFIDDLYTMNTNLSAIVTSNLPDDFTYELPSGKIGTKEQLEKGLAIDVMEKDAIKIAKRLGKNLKNT